MEPSASSAPLEVDYKTLHCPASKFVINPEHIHRLAHPNSVFRLSLNMGSIDASMKVLIIGAGKRFRTITTDTCRLTLQAPPVVLWRMVSGRLVSLTTSSTKERMYIDTAIGRSL
jgi:hypothetical protein